MNLRSELTALTLLLASTLAINAQSNPSVVGQWSPVQNLPVIPVHATLAPNGKVFFWGSYNDSLKPQFFDPTANTVTSATPPPYLTFCAGQSWLSDGRLLVTGGHISNEVGLANASIYDPVANTWTVEPNMNAGRWYPTNTALANGEMLVVSGNIDNVTGVNPLPQVWQPSTNSWRNLTSAQLAMPLYPNMYLAPNGLVFNSSPSQTTRYLNTSGTGAWNLVATSNFGTRDYGSSAMYDTGKILIVGGGDPPTASAETIDLTAQTPFWQYTGSMTYSRRQMNATLLPDGTVLVTGGSSGAGFDNASSPIYPAELWSPSTGQFTTMASNTVYRGYHSVALLLPDGRVFAGGGNVGGPNYEIYSPPYLFNGPRPTITAAPANAYYGDTLFVATPDSATIGQVTVIRVSSVTHSFNQSQRITKLSFSQTSGGLNVIAPTNPNITPPGDYMLFILNGSGVPSLATMLRVVSPVVLSPVDLSFPSQLLNTSSGAQGVTLTNAGTNPLTIFGITSAGDFAQTNTCGGSVLPSASCNISVVFIPATTGLRNGTISIADSAADSPQTIGLLGTGTSAANVSSASLNFGSQIIGTTSASQTVTLTNQGSVALNISSLGTTGDYSQTNTCPSSLAPTVSCTIAVTFSPTVVGTRAGTVAINDDAVGSPQLIALNGTGVSSVSLSPATLTFANQPVGTTSAAQLITLTNQGAATLNISGVNASTNYGAASNCGNAVASGASCTLSITFAPLTGGTLAGTITVNDDALGNPQTIPTLGVGLSSVILAPTSLTFGSQLVGTTSSSQSVTLTNQGTSSINITGITTSGDYAQNNNCGGAIAANASCSISVNFTPTVVGSRTGTVIISDTAAGSPQTGNLTGTGLPAPGLPLLLGDQAVESSITFPSRGLGWAFQTIASASGTVGSMTLFLDASNSATQATIGFYSDNNGHPGTLLTQGNTTQVVSNAWNTIPVTPVGVTSGQPYWIAVVGPPTGLLKIATKSHALLPQYCHSESSLQNNLTNSLPSTWQTYKTYSACPISAYGSAVANQPVLGAAPQSLNFAAVENASNPTPTTVNITNNGTGTLTYSASSDSAWLSLSPTNGTAPQGMVVSPAIQGLAPGTYVGHITLTAAGALASPTVIPVTFNVAPPPALTVTPTALSFNAVQGAPSPPSASINVSNVDVVVGTLNFAIASDSSWLTALPSNGVTPQDIQLVTASAALAAGTYVGHLTITPVGINASPTYVTVTLAVAPAPVLALSASTLSFSEVQGGPDPSAATLNVNNGGGGTLSYAATSDSAWLLVSPGNGTVPQSLQVSVAGSGMTVGSYTGHITVTSDGATNSPQTVAVTFSILPAPTLQLSTSTFLIFAEPQGGTDPASKQFTVSNAGGGILPFTVSSDSNWLTTSSTSGSAPQNIQASVTGAGLSAGTYVGHITISGSAGVQNSPQVITSTFSISPVILGDQNIESTQLNPPRGSALAFGAVATGTGSANYITLYIDPSNTATQATIGVYTDAGGHPGSLLSQTTSTQVMTGAWNTFSISPFMLTAGQPYWIALIGPASGVLRTDEKQHSLSSQLCNSESASQTNLTNSLPTTWSTGIIYSACPVSAYVSVLASQPVLNATPQTLTFNAIQAGNDPAASNVNLKNIGSGVLNYTAASDSNWLNVAPASAGTPQTVQVSPTVANLAAGTYFGHITIAGNGALSSPTVVPVTLAVAPPAALGAAPTSLAFNGTQGGANPAPASLSVSNVNGFLGTINFAAASDSNWLVVSPTSGATPQTLQVSASSTGLTAGTYVGHIVLTPSGLTASSASIPVTFTVAPVPILSLSSSSVGFTVAQGGVNPAAAGVTATNQGNGVLSYSATSDSSWLSVAPASGSAPQNLQISAATAGLLAGTYIGHIAVTGAAGVQNSPQTITVTLTVSPVIIGDQTVESVVANPPRGSALAFGTTATGTGTVSSVTLFVDSANTATQVTLGFYSDAGGHPGSLLSQVTSTQFTAGAWNTYSIPSFNVTAGQSFWIALIGPPLGTLKIRQKQHALLPQFCHSETALQTNLTNSLPATWSSGNTYSGCPVSAYGALTAIPMTLTLSSNSLSFGEIQGGTDPAPSTVSLSNGGGGTLSFTASSDSGWLTVTPSAGTAARGLQISVAGAGLSANTYTGNITVTGATGAQNSPQRISVTFTISSQ